jgi:hypothetical protein
MILEFLEPMLDNHILLLHLFGSSVNREDHHKCHIRDILLQLHAPIMYGILEGNNAMSYSK